jgi:protein-S-isoprenylcysteine O-methyltransferase Ste14
MGDSSGSFGVRAAAALSAVVGGAVLVGLLFVIAGTTDWPGAWAYLVSFGAAGAVSAALAPEEVLRERLKGPVRSGQGGADRTFVVVFGALVVAWFALLGLDRRFGWSSVPAVAQAFGVVLYVLANAVIVWVLRANPFASGAVRLADDQRVATDGPYRIVRHPMYASVIPYLVGTALILGSWVGAVTSVLLVVGLGVRTTIEEGELREGLPGYADYATRVRWRLVPGVW